MDFALSKKKSRQSPKRVLVEPHESHAAPVDIRIDGQYCTMSEDGYLCLSSKTTGLIRKAINGKLKPTALWPESRARLFDMTTFSATISVAGIERTKIMVRVVLMNGTMCFADAVTGSLFYPDGRCLSSHSLRMTSAPSACTKEYAALLLGRADDSEEDE